MRLAPVPHDTGPPLPVGSRDVAGRGASGAPAPNRVRRGAWPDRLLWTAGVVLAGGGVAVFLGFALWQADLASTGRTAPLAIRSLAVAGVVALVLGVVGLVVEGARVGGRGGWWGRLLGAGAGAGIGIGAIAVGVVVLVTFVVIVDALA